MVEHLVAEFTQHTTEILSDAYLFTVCSFHSIQKMLIVQSAVLRGKNGEGGSTVFFLYRSLCPRIAARQTAEEVWLGFVLYKPEKLSLFVV